MLSFSTSLPPSVALCPALLGRGAVGQGVPRPRALISAEEEVRYRSPNTGWMPPSKGPAPRTSCGSSRGKLPTGQG